MKNKVSRIKALFVVLVCGGILPVTAVNCDPYSGFGFYRDDDSGDYYYDDGYYGGGGYYYDDPYYYDPYCDPYNCY